MPARRLALLLALVTLAALTSACSITSSVAGPRTWTMTSAGVDGASYVTNVGDTSGKVMAVEFDPVDAVADGGVVAVPGKPNVLDMPWTGGSCDKLTEIAIAPVGAGLVVTVAITPDETKPCDAMGVIHTLRVTLTDAIAPALVTVRQ